MFVDDIETHAILSRLSKPFPTGTPFASAQSGCRQGSIRPASSGMLKKSNKPFPTSHCYRLIGTSFPLPSCKPSATRTPRSSDCALAGPTNPTSAACCRPAIFTWPCASRAPSPPRSPPSRPARPRRVPRPGSSLPPMAKRSPVPSRTFPITLASCLRWRAFPPSSKSAKARLTFAPPAA